MKHPACHCGKVNEPPYVQCAEGECYHDPFSCPCEGCKEWLVDYVADMAVDERREQ